MTEIHSLIAEAKYCYKTHKYRRAEELFKQVLKSHDGFADVHNHLGLMAHHEGRFNEAIVAFKQALKINPHYTEAMLNLSILYNDIGQYPLAKALVTKSKKEVKKSKHPMDPFIRSKLANKHAEVGDWYRGVGLFKDAIHEYKKALELEAGYSDIRTRMGICLRETGDLPGSLTEFLKASTGSRPYPESFVQMGISQFALGKKAEAVKSWRKANLLAPTHPTVKMYLRLARS